MVIDCTRKNQLDRQKRKCTSLIKIKLTSERRIRFVQSMGRGGGGGGGGRGGGGGENKDSAHQGNEASELCESLQQV